MRVCGMSVINAFLIWKRDRCDALYGNVHESICLFDQLTILIMIDLVF